MKKPQESQEFKWEDGIYVQLTQIDNLYTNTHTHVFAHVHVHTDWYLFSVRVYGTHVVGRLHDQKLVGKGFLQLNQGGFLSGKSNQDTKQKLVKCRAEFTSSVTKE